MPAHFKAVMHLERRFCAPETEDDIRLMSSIKSLTSGRDTFLQDTKLGAGARTVYSSMMLMPAKNKIIERVQPAKIPCI